MVFEHDILCVIETHLDQFDCVDIPGYVFFSQPRTQAYKRKSGGIGIYVKDSISKFVKIDKSCNDYILWLRLDKILLGCNEDIFIGAVYLPPENSRFFTADDFDCFENSILDMCSTHNFVFLAGDFNSRVAKLRDFVPQDRFFTELFDINSDTDLDLNPHLILEELGVPLNRNTNDT